MGNWQRDTVREVDVVQGSFFMIRRALWDELGGFDLRYFMYGEEADLCLRAQALGYRPMITPDAEIMHLAGASTSHSPARKQIYLAKARLTLMEDHWPAWQVPFGRATLILWGGGRALILNLAALLIRRKRGSAQKWRDIWADRKNWLEAY